MNDKIVKILNDETSNSEKRAKLMFFLCFNLLEDDSRLTSCELRRIAYDLLDEM